MIGGAECAFPQEIAVIDPAARLVTMLGTVASRFICTPAVTQLLDEEEDTSAAFGDEAV